MHPIDEQSPLYGITTDQMYDMEFEIMILLSGTDDTLADVIYARHSYTPDEILMGHRFVDVLSIRADGRRTVDLNRFHDTEALSA
jgi:inward rectifier potassium channel